MGFLPVKPNTKRWLKERTKGIGASEAAILWGFNPWTSINDLVNRKIGKDDIQEPVFKMEFGLAAEETIMNWAERRLGTLTNPKGIYYDDRQQYIRATPDRLTTPWKDETGNTVEQFDVVDAKNSGAGAFFKFKKDPALPIYYWMQSQQQMLCAGAKQAYMVVNYANETMAYYRIDRSESFLALHREQCAILWKVIQSYEFVPENEWPMTVFDASLKISANIDDHKDLITTQYMVTSELWATD